MSDESISKAQNVIDLSTTQNGDLIITNQEQVNEVIPPTSFSEDERIRLLAEITEVAAYSHTNTELYEGCIQKTIQVIPTIERATILVDLDGELFPMKHIPRVQAYYSETYARQTKEKRIVFSWLRKQAEGGIPRSMFDAVAAMYAPMIRNGKVVGVFHADSTSLKRGFTKSELDLFSVIANILALSLKPTAPERVIPTVFISYAHKDAEIVHNLKGDLRRNGISVWLDERLRAADDPWRKQLEIAIQKQRYFLFLMTPNSVASKYCLWELETAQKSNTKVISVMLEEVDVPIADLQYVDFRVDYQKGLHVLIKTICGES